MKSVISAQLATLVDEPPRAGGWIHEPKYDGYRLLAKKEGRRVVLYTRNGNDWTKKFPAIAHAVAQIPGRSFVLDGELVAYGRSGKIAFQALQQVVSATTTARLKYFVFDLLIFNGLPLVDRPLRERRVFLKKLIPKTNLIAPSPGIRLKQSSLLAWARSHGFEGIVSKDLAAPYRAGRTRAWLKSKVGNREEFLIIGFTAHSTMPRMIGALLVGLYDGKRFIYCGKVGTGFETQERRRLFALLSPQRAEIAVVNRRSVPRPHVLVVPKLICEVRFGEWTADGRLRHSVYLGLRADKSWRDVRVSTSSLPSAKGAE